MIITTYSALWFLPFVLPICFYVAFTDMREMRITNQAVLALGAVFLAVGLIALPFEVYLWRLAQLAIVLVVGIILNAAGAMGAGDSKFIAVAAPFVAQGDVRMLIPLFCIIMLGSALSCWLLLQHIVWSNTRHFAASHLTGPAGHRERNFQWAWLLHPL